MEMIFHRHVFLKKCPNIKAKQLTSEKGSRKRWDHGYDGTLKLAIYILIYFKKGGKCWTFDMKPHERRKLL